jgi:hypothetical protein
VERVSREAQWKGGGEADSEYAKSWRDIDNETCKDLWKFDETNSTWFSYSWLFKNPLKRSVFEHRES